MTAYYNENDPFAAAWLRELIKANQIAPGDVDERSIEDVRPADLAGYTQCHFFAGIGVWSYALRSAGWADHRPVWTGSCPCQPFSSAGKGSGFDDERHLWPAFHWLIRQCRPDVVFGEQVAGKAGLTWLDLVQADLEMEGYACGHAVTAACGFGAPHQRKRLYWMADSGGQGLSSCQCEAIQRTGRREEGRATEQCGSSSGSMADASRVGRSEERALDRGERCGDRQEGRPSRHAAGGLSGSLGNTELLRCDQRQPRDTREAKSPGSECRHEPDRPGATSRGPGPTNGEWRDADWIFCRDGKWRPVEPGTFPLVDGAPARVGRLRGYGNAIVAQQAQAFIEAYRGH